MRNLHVGTWVVPTEVVLAIEIVIAVCCAVLLQYSTFFQISISKEMRQSSIALHCRYLRDVKNRAPACKAGEIHSRSI